MMTTLLFYKTIRFPLEHHKIFSNWIRPEWFIQRIFHNNVLVHAYMCDWSDIIAQALRLIRSNQNIWPPNPLTHSTSQTEQNLKMSINWYRVDVNSMYDAGYTFPQQHTLARLPDCTGGSYVLKLKGIICKTRVEITIGMLLSLRSHLKNIYEVHGTEEKNGIRNKIDFIKYQLTWNKINFHKYELSRKFILYNIVGRGVVGYDTGVIILYYITLLFRFNSMLCTGLYHPSGTIRVH